MYSIVYDENTDPNILAYGKNTELTYLQKANFADERIEKDYDKSEPRSGTIEVFSNKKEAIDRAALLNESEEDEYSYRIVADNILVRLSKDYTNEQAQEIAEIAGGEIHSLDHETEIRDKFGDTLNKFQGEWQNNENKYMRLVIKNEELNFISESSIKDRNYRDINTFVFDFDEKGNLVVSNQYSQPRYNISFDKNGVLEISSVSDDTETRTYVKVSDSTEVPEEILEPAIGMTESEVYSSTWGTPEKINKTETVNGIHEQWVYENGYIYFDNGYVTSIQK